MALTTVGAPISFSALMNTPTAIHVLVHNVAHTDLVLELRQPAEGAGSSSSGLGQQLLFAKPAYDKYASITEKLMAALSSADIVNPADVELVYQSCGNSTPSASVHGDLPYGIRLRASSDQKPITLRPADLVFRDAETGLAMKRLDECAVEAIYFPIVAALMPQWLSALKARASKGKKQAAPPATSSAAAGVPTTTTAPAPSSSSSGSSSSSASKKVVYLLSGPAVSDDSDNLAEASTTEHVAELIALFLQKVTASSTPADNLTVAQVASGAEVLRYDTNVAFLKTSLLPLIDAQRRVLVSHFSESWKKRFSVCVSLAAGAPARLAALNAAVRTYQPSYIHFSNVKAFWFSGLLDSMMASVHLLDFDSVEGTPSVALGELEGAGARAAMGSAGPLLLDSARTNSSGGGGDPDVDAEVDEDARQTVMQMKAHMRNVLRVVRGTDDHRIIMGPGGVTLPPSNMAGSNAGAFPVTANAIASHARGASYSSSAPSCSCCSNTNTTNAGGSDHHHHHMRGPSPLPLPGAVGNPAMLPVPMPMRSRTHSFSADHVHGIAPTGAASGAPVNTSAGLNTSIGGTGGLSSRSASRGPSSASGPIPPKSPAMSPMGSSSSGSVSSGHAGSIPSGAIVVKAGHPHGAGGKQDSVVYCSPAVAVHAAAAPHHMPMDLDVVDTGRVISSGGGGSASSSSSSLRSSSLSSSSNSAFVPSSNGGGSGSAVAAAQAAASGSYSNVSAGGHHYHHHQNQLQAPHHHLALPGSVLHAGASTTLSGSTSGNGIPSNAMVAAPPTRPAGGRTHSSSSSSSLGTFSNDGVDSEDIDHELASFWLRKTRQPVLAVLLVRKGPGQPRQFYYGCNVEVSMPTGSICSERVAISTALAADPGLKRAHIRMVAVLSLPKLDHPDARVQLAYEGAGVAPASTFYAFNRQRQASIESPPPFALPAMMGPPGRLQSHHSQHSLQQQLPQQQQAQNPLSFSPMHGTQNHHQQATLPSSSSASGLDAFLMPPPPPQGAGKKRKKAAADGATGGASSAASSSSTASQSGNFPFSSSSASASESLRSGASTPGLLGSTSSHGPAAAAIGVAGASADSESEGHRSVSVDITSGSTSTTKASRQQSFPSTGTGAGAVPAAAAAGGSTARRDSVSSTSSSGTAASVPGSSAVAAPAAKRARVEWGGDSTAQPQQQLQQQQSTPTKNASHHHTHAHPGSQPRSQVKATALVPSLGGAAGSGAAGGATAAGGSFMNQVSPNSREMGYASVRKDAGDGLTTIEIPVALNPIAPCGSCMEWLRKISEVNPDFRIITFTDISCERIFIKSVPS